MLKLLLVCGSIVSGREGTEIWLIRYGVVVRGGWIVIRVGREEKLFIERDWALILDVRGGLRLRKLGVRFCIFRIICIHRPGSSLGNILRSLWIGLSWTRRNRLCVDELLVDLISVWKLFLHFLFNFKFLY